jgi:chemotaxis family two-component system response regulator PixG
MPNVTTRFHILIVEDEPSLLESIVDLLAFNGHVVSGAKNGIQALQRVREHLPDLIISDVMMPEMDGYQLVRQLRESPTTAQTPIILLSGHTSSYFIEEGLSLGANSFIKKPFELDDFLQVVDDVLAASRP